MNFFKRALLSIKRKPGKSLLLFLIIFILCNVIAGAVAIQLGTENVERNIKESLGAVYSISMDHEQIAKDSEEAAKNGEEFDYESIEPVTKDIIQAIGQSAYVKQYDYSVKTQMGSDTITPFMPVGSEEFYGPDYAEQMKDWIFSVNGTNYAPVLTISEGKEKLVSGRVFTEEEISAGAKVILINKKLADQNGIQVGDDLLFNSKIYDYENIDSQGQAPVTGQVDLALQVIGIYENIEEPTNGEAAPAGSMENMMKMDRDISRGNTIYTTNEAVSAFNLEYFDKSNLSSELTDEQRERMVQSQYQPLFVLNSLDDAENFISDSNAILPKYNIVVSNDASFQNIAGPLQQTSKLAGYVLYVAIGAALLIITLVVLLFLRDRKHELGIYMSLGEKKGLVLTQILAEVLLVAIIAVTLSVFSGNLLATTLSDTMVKDRLIEQDDDGMVYYGDDWVFGQFAHNVSQEDIVDNYSIKLTPSYIGLIYLIGIGSVLVATIVPMLYIVRLNPKKVLM